MKFVKKWFSCILSFVCGVLGLALSACSGMIVKATVDLSALGAQSLKIDEMTKAFKVITDNDLYKDAKSLGIGTEFVWLKLFAILTLIISVLLIVYSLIKLLQNVNVIKTNHIAIDIVGHSLFVAFLVSAIGLLICTCVYANELENNFITKVVALANIPEQYISAVKVDCKVTSGLYQYIILAVSIIAFIANGVVAFLKRKDI